MPQRIIVTGCGRTGTQYTAAVFTALGIRCRHEGIYRHDNTPLERLRLWEDRDADISWEAAAFPDEFPDGAVIWHQTRDPMRSIQCFEEHHSLFLDERADSMRLVRGILPECGIGSNLERAVWYLVKWNERIESFKDLDHLDYHRYRVEDLQPAILHRLLTAAGYGFSMGEIAGVLNVVATDVGRCHHHDNPVTWERILATPCGEALRQLCRRYGYKAPVKLESMKSFYRVDRSSASLT